MKAAADRARMSIELDYICYCQLDSTRTYRDWRKLNLIQYRGANGTPISSITVYMTMVFLFLFFFETDDGVDSMEENIFFKSRD